MGDDTFSIEFNGKDFDSHQIPVETLANSLLALDGISQAVAKALYGKDIDAKLKVNGGFREGSFIADLYIACQNNPIEAATLGVTVCGLAVNALKDLVKLAKFAFGKNVEVTTEPDANNRVSVRNITGDVSVFNNSVVNLYNNSRTQSQISRFTNPLDSDGVTSIKLFSGEEDENAQEITKADRYYLKKEEGIVLTDNDSEAVIEIVSPMLDGSKEGWKFSEGDGGITFSATVEDEEFLEKIKNKEIQFVRGICIRATVRVVQSKVKVRTKTTRTITEVKEVIPSEI